MYTGLWHKSVRSHSDFSLRNQEGWLIELLGANGQIWGAVSPLPWFGFAPVDMLVHDRLLGSCSSLWSTKQELCVVVFPLLTPWNYPG